MNLSTHVPRAQTSSYNERRNQRLICNDKCRKQPVDPRGLRSQWAHDTPGECPPAEKAERKPRASISHSLHEACPCGISLARRGAGRLHHPLACRDLGSEAFPGSEDPPGGVGGGNRGAYSPSVGRPCYRPRMCTSFKEVTKLVKTNILIQFSHFILKSLIQVTNCIYSRKQSEVCPSLYRS